MRPRAATCCGRRLYYIDDEFTERLRHLSESNVLFPRIARWRPEVMPVIARLEKDHVHLRFAAKLRDSTPTNGSAPELSQPSVVLTDM